MTTPFPHDLLECRRCGTFWGTLGDEIPSACPTCYLEDWISTADDRDVGVDIDTLVCHRDMVLEFYMLHGRAPSVSQMRKALRQPGL